MNLSWKHQRWQLFTNAVGFLLVLQSPSSAGAKRNGECSELEFSECLKSFDTILAHQNLGFAVTENELNTACRYLKDGVNCIDQFVKRCTRDKFARESLTGSVKGAFDILDLLCEDTYHRNQYLQHAECYRRIASQIEDCMKPMRNMGLRRQNQDEKSKVDETVCCAYQNATECIHQVSEKECNDRAATFLKNYTDRAAQPITMQCRGFDSKVCPKSSSSSRLPVSSWIRMSVLLFGIAQYIV
ncbi:hypothetical protein RvY_05358-1 [Ramazzottius varieornatus]|uniref:DUF19 domain-containing protein n=1 Tax=Ramazzottius varieornatus TaxID=947166 RepID=A0A1D1UXU5_RAMVA|nr:hypothetical protein RvY_05358-1 [Ramazzottius varieornatus]